MLDATTAAASTTASIPRPGGRRKGQYATAAMSSGATSRSPPMSPSHHTRQTEPNSPTDTSSPTTRLPTPLVAAIAVLSTVTSGTPVHAFARSAPRATPGHTDDPQRTNAARAMPVGGQIAVTLLVSK